MMSHTEFNQRANEILSSVHDAGRYAATVQDHGDHRALVVAITTITEALLLVEQSRRAADQPVDRTRTAAVLVHDAWTHEGPHPPTHQRAKDAVRKNWPSLANALDTLDREMP